jgi:hypothetical protein
VPCLTQAQPEVRSVHPSLLVPPPTRRLFQVLYELGLFRVERLLTRKIGLESRVSIHIARFHDLSFYLADAEC